MNSEKIIRVLNSLAPAGDTDLDLIRWLSVRLFAECGENLILKPPLYVESPERIRLGHDVFINTGCSFHAGFGKSSEGTISIGPFVKIGPGTRLYTIKHSPYENGNILYTANDFQPVVLEERCKIGGGCIVLPGVVIGHEAIIGAGSVVTKSIPPRCIAVGNPCRVVRQYD